ncbi:MAG: class I SAM-dependent methyltransferase [Chitinophagaceae bacterium]|nr:class I SAM-dependent methyltransferase [Chitinophagaceae bacterium]
MGLRAFIRKKLNRGTNPVQASDGYDHWSHCYDAEPGNLMLVLDAALMAELKGDLLFAGKTIADVGCGTGRYWQQWYAEGPASLTGFDVSEGMLSQLKQKYPAALVQHIGPDQHLPLADSSCDVLLSNLAFAHFPSLEQCFSSWDRVAKAGADIFLTDYHPDALSKGASVSFTHRDQTIFVRHYLYPLEQVMAAAGKLGWETLGFTERVIDDAVRHFYESQQALAVFERFKNVKIIYGVHFRKR